jgi:hypothetical protein
VSKCKTKTLEGSIEDIAVRTIGDSGEIEVRQIPLPEPVHS